MRKEKIDASEKFKTDRGNKKEVLNLVVVGVFIFDKFKTRKLQNKKSTFKLTLNSLWTWGTENCSVTRPISLNKWLDNLLVKLYALLQHQNALQYVMSSSYSTVFWLLLYLTDKKKQENSIKHIFVYMKKIAVFKVFMFDVVTIRHKLSLQQRCFFPRPLMF